MSVDVLMRAFLYCGFALVIAVQPSFADRAAYSGARDIVADGATITVRHHHDWSRISIKDDGWVLRYSAATPFGVDEETSNLEFYSSQGALVARTPSPPLTYLKISADDRYVIGLSDIKHLNATQLVVFSPKGELLLRRRISAHVYCFDVAGYLDLKRKHREAFGQLDRYSQLSHDSYGWREGDSVYLDIPGGIGEPYGPLYGMTYFQQCATLPYLRISANPLRTGFIGIPVRIRGLKWWNDTGGRSKFD